MILYLICLKLDTWNVPVSLAVVWYNGEQFWWLW